MSGNAPWVTDGIPQGTYPLGDINDVSRDPIWASNFIQFGSTVYFTAQSQLPSHGTQLWRTDGTERSARLVRDNLGGTDWVLGPSLKRFGDRVCSRGGTADAGDELVCTDGTPDGTGIVKDIWPGSGSGVRDGDFAVAGDHLYFPANDGTHGPTLWKTDGTEGGTVPVDPAGAPLRPEQLLSVGSRVYFVSPDAYSGYELWTSDGTADGTHIVRDIKAGSDGSNPSGMTAFGDKLYFTANDGVSGAEPWSSDGTEDGTTRVADINLGVASSDASNFSPVGTELFFSANDGVHSYELWKHDPVSGGTMMVKDINPSGSSIGSKVTDLGGVAYFEGLDGTTGGGLSGGELFRSDGTPENTSLARDINPGAEGSNPGSWSNMMEEPFTAFEGSLLFVAYDPDHGIELWRADPPRLTISAPRFYEGDRGTRTLKFRARLSRTPDSPVQITFATKDGRAKAGYDYVASSGTVTIPAGQAGVSIPVKVIGDKRRERDESFSVVAGPIGRRPVIVRPTIRGRIADDD